MTLLSPGLETKEKDLTATIGRAATGRGATVGKAQWGPAFQIIQLSDEADQVDRVGLPDDYTFATFFSVANFLKYANDCRFVRIVNPDIAKNSTPLYNNAVVTISNDGTNYEVGDSVSIQLNDGIQQLDTITISGTPTIDVINYEGNAFTVAGRQIEVLTFSNASPANNLPTDDITVTVRGIDVVNDGTPDYTATTVADNIATALDADPDYIATNNGSVITLTHSGFGPQAQTPTVQQNGIHIATLVTTPGIAPVGQEETLSVNNACSSSGSIILTGSNDLAGTTVAVTSGNSTAVVAAAIADEINLGSIATATAIGNKVYIVYSSITNAGPQGSVVGINGNSTSVTGSGVKTLTGVTGIQQVETLTVTGTAILTWVIGGVTVTHAPDGAVTASYISSFATQLQASPIFSTAIASGGNLITATRSALGSTSKVNEITAENNVTYTSAINTAGYILTSSQIADDVATYLDTDIGHPVAGISIGADVKLTWDAVGSQSKYSNVTQGGVSLLTTTTKAGIDNSILLNSGYVSSVGAGGQITGIYIPTQAMVDNDPEETYTLTIDDAHGTAAAATATVNRTSNIYFPNTNAADAAIEVVSTAMNSASLPTIFAKYPGAYGDDISVDVITYADYNANRNSSVTIPVANLGGTVTVAMGLFSDNQPQTTDQYGVIVRYKGEVQEKLVVSTNPSDKDIYGSSMYIDDVFTNESSSYIQASAASWPTTSAEYRLGGGVDTGVTVDQYLTGWDFFNDPDEIYVNLLFAGAAANESVEDSSIIQKYIANSVAEVRRDCLAWLSVPTSLVVGVANAADCVDNVLGWRTGFYQGGDAAEFNCNVNTSFVSFEGNAKFQQDKYNDRKRWVGTTADCAGLCALTDRIADVWDSPAGFTRGQVKDVIKLAYNTKRTHRDILYPAGVNSIVNFTGRGNVLYGDKTGQTVNSAFSQINVRRLFNLLEKSIGDAAQSKLFENNTTFTRNSFALETSAYLDIIKGRGGVIDFFVWCDERNNPPAVVDRNEFVGTIYIKPPRSINYIQLNFVATSSGANFQELLVANI